MVGVGGQLLSWCSLLLLPGLPRPWRAAREQATGTELGCPHSPGVFWGSLGHTFSAAEVPPSIITMHTDVAPIFSYIFYSLTKQSKYSPNSTSKRWWVPSAYLQHWLSILDPSLCQCHVRCLLLSALEQTGNLLDVLLSHLQERQAASGTEPAPSSLLLPAHRALCDPSLHP